MHSCNAYAIREKLPGNVQQSCDGSIIISARCVPVDRNAVLTRPFFNFPGGLSKLTSDNRSIAT